MKFKVGDKVIPRKFSSYNSEGVAYNPHSMNKFVGKECEITQLYDFGYQLDYGYTWIESALDLVEPKEYFYVGQTVYSPLFQNKERKAVIVDINKSWNFPIKCNDNGVRVYFLLDGRHLCKHDFVSLFQEPIQFPVNKPIERFEEGEIVEVSSNDEYWRLARFVSYNDHDVLRYKVTITTGIDREVKETFNYSSIRKVK